MNVNRSSRVGSSGSRATTSGRRSPDPAGTSAARSHRRVDIAADCMAPRLAAVPTIRANGLDIAYGVVGAGPALVLLHGATSSGREDFAAQLPAMSKAFLVHVPDARGHGRTKWDAADGFSYEWLVEDLKAFVDALG